VIEAGTAGAVCITDKGIEFRCPCYFSLAGDQQAAR
jgi:hypothetical protein